MVLGALLDTLSDIGAVGGILSILGIGVLILLLASQAREIKAMREWIEAEPERQAAAQQQTISEVQRRIAAARERRAGAQGAKPPAPGAKPLVPGAKPPVPAVPAAVAAGATAAAGASTAPPAPGGPVTPPAPGTPATPPVPGAAPATPGDGDAASKPAFAPLVPAAGSVPPPSAEEPDEADDLEPDATAPGQETQLADPLPPAFAASRARETVYDDEDFELVDEEPRGGNRTLFAVGVAILIAGIVLLGVLLLGGGDEQPTASDSGTAAETEGGGGGGGDAAASTPDDAVDPSSVTVRVLNGTTVTGLAQNVTDQLADKGYGSVAPDTYSSNQSLAETTIAYREGYKDAAEQVAEDLGLSSDAVQPMDAEIRVAATEQADVAVLVGTDLDNGTSPTTG